MAGEDQGEALKYLAQAVEALQKGHQSAEAERERRFLLSGVESNLDNLRKELEKHYATKDDVSNAKLWMVICVCTAVLSLLSPAAIIFSRFFLNMLGIE